LVKILSEHPVWTSIAGVGKISDLGSGTRNLDYGNVLLHVTVYSKGNAGNEWKSPFLHAQKKVNKPKVKPVQHANEQEDFIGLRLQQLAAGKWDRKKLISGETVCFTQFDNELREKLENKAASRGLVVSSSVTKKLSLLVIDANSLMDSAKAKKAIQYGIPISNLPGYILENSD
jgi:NAD-dependent DNA ligase